VREALLENQHPESQIPNQVLRQQRLDLKLLFRIVPTLTQANNFRAAHKTRELVELGTRQTLRLK